MSRRKGQGTPAEIYARDKVVATLGEDVAKILNEFFERGSDREILESLILAGFEEYRNSPEGKKKLEKAKAYWEFFGIKHETFNGNGSAKPKKSEPALTS